MDHVQLLALIQASTSPGIGLIVFLGIHSISIVAPNFRDGLAARIGAGPWRGIYSLISVIGLVLVIWGYGLARREPVVLYSPPYWTHYVTAVLMLPVFPFIFAPYLPGRIKAVLKHPMLVAVKLWAVAHLLTNGEARSLVLFGGLLAWAVLEVIFINRRDGARIKPPRVGLLRTTISALIGLLVTGLLVFVHPWLSGMPVIALR